MSSTRVDVIRWRRDDFPQPAAEIKASLDASNADAARRRPAFEQLLGSFRVDARPGEFLRVVQQPQDGWIFTSTPTLTVPQQWPAIEQLLRSFRVAERQQEFLGAVQQPQDGWVSAFIEVVTPEIASNYPAIEQLLRSFRSDVRPQEFLRAVSQPDFGWVQNVVGVFDPINGLAAYEQLWQSYRVRAVDPIVGNHLVYMVSQPPISWLTPEIAALVSIKTRRLLLMGVGR